MITQKLHNNRLGMSSLLWECFYPSPLEVWVFVWHLHWSKHLFQIDVKVERNVSISLICSRNLKKWMEAPVTVFISSCILSVRSCGRTVPPSSAAGNSVFVSRLPKGSAAPTVNDNLLAVRDGWAAPWCVLWSGEAPVLVPTHQSWLQQWWAVADRGHK